MTVVRAKFHCYKAEGGEGAASSQVQLGAVCRGIENAMWAQATPSGSITMNVKNDPAFEQFEQGAEYEVTFRKVAKPMPNDGHEIQLAVDMHGRQLCEFCGQTLGYTDEAVEKQSYLAQYNTEEKRAEYRQMHDTAFGPLPIDDNA